ncbi:MAG TPA: hypothetical protein VKP61_05405 [Candidatus Acidoferrum sp.]|nr:hypothetical protein [Candidatus Acidoferrum sp.]
MQIKNQLEYKLWPTLQVTSGLVPEYFALIQERSQIAAEMPDRFAQDMAVEQDDLIAAGMDPAAAAGQAFAFEVNKMQNWFSSDPDAASWLNMWQGLNQSLVTWANRWSSVFPYSP